MFDIKICNMRAANPKAKWEFRVDRMSPVGNPFYMNDEKLTQETVELRGERDNPYFEYGVMNDKIFIDDFETVEGDAA